MGQHILTTEEYDALRAKIVDAEAKAAAIERRMIAMRAVSPNEATKQLRHAYELAKAIVDFAVANLHPEFIRGMPWEELGELAKIVEEVGGHPRDGERAIVWRTHADMIIKYETERQLKGKADPREVDPHNGGPG